MTENAIPAESPQPVEGTVTRIRSVLCEVDAGGEVYACKARGRLVEGDTGESKPLVVGDQVIITPVGEGEAVVEEVLPRRTRLSRQSPNDHRSEHVIVANVDQLLIVASVGTPPLSLGIIDRYVIAGEVGNIEPVICVNKTDLAEDPSEYAHVAPTYEAMDYRVLFTSALTGENVEELRAVLRDQTTVLAGHSGVGKSALLNAVQPGLKLKTGDLYRKGRHTTTWASLLKLDGGGYVVDTPGIREFAIWDVKKVEVAQFFPQIWELSQDCRMPDCMHVREPDCAVLAALERGDLPPTRYESYLRIMETVEEEKVPRATDVEDPAAQIKKKLRTPSRRSRKQKLRRMAEELRREDEEDTDD